MSDLGEQQWQPLSALPAVSVYLQEAVKVAAEILETLGKVRAQPYLLGDGDVARMWRTFSQTREDLVTLWAPQGQRWAELDLDEADRQEVARFQAWWSGSWAWSRRSWPWPSSCVRERSLMRLVQYRLDVPGDGGVMFCQLTAVSRESNSLDGEAAHIRS